MEVSAALRRVKRQFGDEYGVVLNDQDIYDWIYDAELDIIRAISDNDKTIKVAITQFPIAVPDRVNIKRLAVNGKTLEFTSVPELDINQASLTTKSTTGFWYFQGGYLNVWPLPQSGDTTIVDITYSKTPIPMTVIAPYFAFVNSATAIQYGFVGNDDDVRLATDVNVEFEMSIGAIGTPMEIVYCSDGTINDSGFHFEIRYNGFTSTTFTFIVGDGASRRTFNNLTFVNNIVAGQRFKFRIVWDSDLGSVTLYRTDLTSGVETIQSTPANIGTYRKQTTSLARFYIGNINGNTGGTPPYMNIYSMQFWSNRTKDNSVFYMNVGNDVANIPTISANTTFNSTDGHLVQTFNGLLIPSANSFTVPELYHEDLVKYCLSRAHSKNQNFRAAEAEMEQYDRRVSTRRNEAQSTDAVLYKIADPNDYDLDCVENYGSF